jgi:NAD(P)H dehydrogenase (quinone)
MIVITGATGALNGATVEHLLEHLPAGEIGVSVRDVAKAQHLADRGVRVRRGTYEEPAALLDSFEGADQILLVSANDLSVRHRTAIETAAASGAKRILYTSHQNADPASPFAAAPVHAAAEADLAASGTAWTSLRNGFYAHSLAWLLGPWRETGVIAAPADGPVSWTDRADLAEAAAVLLAGDEPPIDGPVTLTARSAVTFDDIARIASEVTGRRVERVVVDDEQWVADQIENGAPEFNARLLLGFFQAARRGDFAATGPDLTRLLGREPRSIRDLLSV